MLFILHDIVRHPTQYEIQFIDGDNSALFKAVGVNQANLENWFERYEAMDEDDAVKAIYLADHLGYRLDDMIDKLDDVCLFEGTAIEYAESYIEDTGLLEQMPENLRFYFDTEAFARDMVLNGDIAELRVDNMDYVVAGC